MTATRYLNATQFADLYGFLRCTVSRWLKVGKLPGAFFMGGRWHIPDPGYEYAMRWKQGPLVLARDIPMFRVAEVTKIVNRKPRTLKDWRKSGKLRGIKLNHIWLYSIADIERALRPRGNPKIKGVVHTHNSIRYDLVEWGKKQIAQGPPPLPDNPLDKA